jgi:hypothetical protein
MTRNTLFYHTQNYTVLAAILKSNLSFHLFPLDIVSSRVEKFLENFFFFKCLLLLKEALLCFKMADITVCVMLTYQRTKNATAAVIANFITIN